jgi:hypothetical protein
VIGETIKAYARTALLGVLILAAVATGLYVVDLQLELADSKAAEARTGKAFATYIGEQATKTSQLQTANRAEERRLQALASNIRQETANEILSLRADRDAALERLRVRPSRPVATVASGELPSPAGAAAVERSCTGAGLYREDGEFLVGEAAVTRELRAELLATRALYDAARASQQLSQGAN